MATNSVSLPKPRWRGRLHQFAFYFSIPQGIVLVIAAGADWVSRAGAGVYALSLAGLYGVSASYHRLKWTPPALSRMRRLDHSMIFVLIAGTYTAVSLLALEGWWSTALLIAIWFGAAVGIVLKIFGMERTRKITGGMYIGLGWVAVLAAPQFVQHVRPLVLGLIIAGGILYTGGAIVLALQRPNPNPYVFGYHEVWHVMVVAASLCHYAAIMLLLVQQ